MPRPRPRAAVTTLPLDDELVLYEPESGQAHVLNPTAAHIWTLCDGERTVEAVSEALAAAYGVDYARASADVRTLISGLVEAGLLVSDAS